MKTFRIILFTVLISGGLTVASIYFFIKHKTTIEKNNLQSQIIGLNATLTTTQASLGSIQATLTPATGITTPNN